jgi:hypothetical protein
MRPLASSSSSVVEQGQSLCSENLPVPDLHLRIVPFEVRDGDHALREHLQDRSNSLERSSVKWPSVEDEAGGAEGGHWGLVAPTKRAWTAGAPAEARPDEDGVAGIDRIGADDAPVPDPTVGRVRRDEEHRPLGRGRPRKRWRSDNLRDHEADRITRDQKWERQELPWLPLKGVPEESSDVWPKAAEFLYEALAFGPCSTQQLYRECHPLTNMQVRNLLAWADRKTIVYECGKWRRVT